MALAVKVCARAPYRSATLLVCESHQRSVTAAPTIHGRSRSFDRSYHRYQRVNHLARKPNYDFEKRRKEEERKKKKEEKRARRQAGGDNGADDQADGSEETDDTVSSDPE